MHEVTDHGDLLTLIGQAIDELRQSIEQFEAGDQPGAMEHLSVVVEEIDTYLGMPEEDPLLRLASLSPVPVEEGLRHIQSDLTSVLHDLRSPA